MLQDHPRFAFVIDTGIYVGSFTRELFAFMTGAGSNKETEAFRQSCPERMFQDLLMLVMPVVSVFGISPVQIWPDPGSTDEDPSFKSIAIFLRRPPTADQVRFLTERARVYCAHERIPLIDFRLIQIHLVCTEVPLPE